MYDVHLSINWHILHCDYLVVPKKLYTEYASPEALQHNTITYVLPEAPQNNTRFISKYWLKCCYLHTKGLSGQNLGKSSFQNLSNCPTILDVASLQRKKICQTNFGYVTNITTFSHFQGNVKFGISYFTLSFRKVVYQFETLELIA